MNLILRTGSWCGLLEIGDVCSTSTSIGKTMKRTQEKVEEEASYRQRVVLNRLHMLLAAKVFIPFVRHGRGRPINIIHHRLLKANRRGLLSAIYRILYAVINFLRPVGRSNSFGETGHNERRYRQALSSLAVADQITFYALGPEETFMHLGQ